MVYTIYYTYVCIYFYYTYVHSYIHLYIHTSIYTSIHPYIPIENIHPSTHIHVPTSSTSHSRQRLNRADMTCSSESMALGTYLLVCTHSYVHMYTCTHVRIRRTLRRQKSQAWCQLLIAVASRMTCPLESP